MKYIKLFNNDAEYQQFKEGENYITPNLCLNKETMQVILNPKINPKLTQNYLTFDTLTRAAEIFYFISEFPVTSDLTIEATYYHPRLGTQTNTYHMDKGNTKINETISSFYEWENVIITPQKDDKYEYIWNAPIIYT